MLPTHQVTGNQNMSVFRKILRAFFKMLAALFIGLVALIFLLGIASFIADEFFDNAAKKDACADSGGAWDYHSNMCQHERTEE